MRRRDFISVLAVILSACTSAHAQQGGQKRVGILMSAPLPPLETFRHALRELGYREGENIRIEERFAGATEDRYPALAADLVAARTDVIVTWGTPATLAAKRATPVIPVVMAAIGNPVSIGAVASLARPGGNITGLSTLNTELESKRLEILKEVVPNLTRVGVLTNATSPYAAEAVHRLRRDAAARGLTVEEVAVRDRDDLDARLEALARARPEAVVVVADSFLTGQHARIVKAMAESRLPAIYGYREAALGGGLIAYGADYHELFRRAAGYVDKILRGANPGDLPIEQPTRFELVVNLKAAKLLELNIPDSFLVRADEVIE
jgi:putative ABC transport system substrate-binding protein